MRIALTRLDPSEMLVPLPESTRRGRVLGRVADPGGAPLAAVLVTVAAVIGSVPYIALQLKAVDFGDAPASYATLNSAVFTDGSFVYVPKGVRCPMELSTYFRINAANTGQFERTLIIADEGAEVHYIEGCTAPSYSSDSLHSAVVELIARKDATIHYTTDGSTPTPASPLWKGPLQPQQAFFGFQSPGITPKASVAAQDAVAGHND